MFCCSNLAKKLCLPNPRYLFHCTVRVQTPDSRGRQHFCLPGVTSKVPNIIENLYPSSDLVCTTTVPGPSSRLWPAIASSPRRLLTGKQVDKGCPTRDCPAPVSDCCASSTDVYTVYPAPIAILCSSLGWFATQSNSLSPPTRANQRVTGGPQSRITLATLALL